MNNGNSRLITVVVTNVVTHISITRHGAKAFAVQNQTCESLEALMVGGGLSEETKYFLSNTFQVNPETFDSTPGADLFHLPSSQLEGFEEWLSSVVREQQDPMILNPRDSLQQLLGRPHWQNVPPLLCSEEVDQLYLQTRDLVLFRHGGGEEGALDAHFYIRRANLVGPSHILAKLWATKPFQPWQEEHPPSPFRGLVLDRVFFTTH